MKVFRHPQTGDMRRVADDAEAQITALEAQGYVKYVQPKGSLLPPPYQEGLVIYWWQTNKNNPKA